MLQPCEKCQTITAWDLVQRPNPQGEFPSQYSDLEPLANQLGLARCRECASPGCFMLEPGSELGIDEKLADPDLVQLFAESLEAEKKGQLRLALMGYKGVLDLCLNSAFGHDIGTFVGKLEEAQNRGFLTPVELRHLELILTAGHTLAMGRFDPDPEVIPWVRSITFRLIKGTYEKQDMNLACQMLTDNLPEAQTTA